MPTSKTAKSTFLSLKYCIAIAVVISKNVHNISLSHMSSEKCLRYPVSSDTSSSDMSRPSTFMRSLNLNMWGEVYNPTE